MDASRETAGVVAPPPLLALAALAVGLIASWAAPIDLLAEIAAPVRYVLCAALAVLAVTMFVAAARGFVRAGTPLQTRLASIRLVTSGIYAHVRNPIYVAFLLLLLAIAFAAAADWLVATSIVFAVVIHFGVVRREERYLEARFGDEYRAYMARVPRYGWRLRRD
jgi:protein-S-isoprenylcysteine O-methyltransferase Ste14